MENKSKLIFIIFILLIVFSSCSSLKFSAITDNHVELNANNINLINGCYHRFPIDSFRGNDARNLHRLFSLKVLDFQPEDAYVRLEIIDERHIKYELVEIDSVIYSKVLKGKLINGEFEFNWRAKILPIIVATIYSDSKVRLGVLENGNLIIDAKCMEYGLVYFILPTFPGADKDYDQEFERIKNCN